MMRLIYIGSSKIHNTGVFSQEGHRKGDQIEVCPIILVPQSEVALIDETVLYNYYFSWTSGAAAICLGYGSLYNHSYYPNAQYIKHYNSKTIVFECIRDIASGEEIVVNYNGEPTCQKKVWFDI